MVSHPLVQLAHKVRCFRYIRLRCNESDPQLPLEMLRWGLSRYATINLQIDEKKGVFFNLTHQTNPSMFSVPCNEINDNGAFQWAYCSHYVAYCYGRETRAGKGRDGMEDISANVDNASNLVHQTNSSESFMKQRRYVAYNCNEACDSDAESYVGTSHDQH